MAHPDAALLEELEAARFLAQAGATLAQVVDHEETLERIAALAVPRFADWFGVHVRAEDGAVRRIAVRHQDPVKERAVEELYRRYPPGEGKPYGAMQVIATGEAAFLPLFEAAIGAVQRDAEHGRMLRALGLRSFICVPMRSHGNVVGALTFATAESGRVYGPVQLAAAEDLATRAAIAIENAQLLEALREADRRKDEFLAVLAHELRNPLAPLRNAVGILRARPALAPEGQWVNDMIDRQVSHMARLVDDLLDVSRITRGRIELRRERVALSALVAAALEASQPAIERAGHELVVRLPVDEIWLDADAVRMAQVLGNLLNNAARYTPAGGRIVLTAAREGEAVAIRVEDNGVGIAAGMLDRVFEMFVQVAVSQGRGQGGLGIGLTLVRRLVELHGGTVEAASAGPGQGSVFTVRLPAPAILAHSRPTE